ncbi:MAG: peptidylprolyl isomerase [Burkholderiales bacterium]|nr:peptidylprolyl isomerase [Burkholderiales bacterium]
MKRLYGLLLACLLPLAHADNPHVVLDTTAGEIELELFPTQAPRSVQNFLDYVKKGQYTNTIFHRVIAGFVIQGGGFTPDMVEKPVAAPIPNESHNGLSNVTGSLAMARRNAPDSATSQFYINLADNTPLDANGIYAMQGWGYAVFGRVIHGMAVVNQIGNQPTGFNRGVPDVPVTPIIVKKARILSAKESRPVPADAPNPFPTPTAATPMPAGAQVNPDPVQH